MSGSIRVQKYVTGYYQVQNSPSVIEIALVAQQQGRKVRRQPKIGELFEQTPGLLKAALARHAVNDDERLAPSYVRVQAAVFLQPKIQQKIQ